MPAYQITPSILSSSVTYFNGGASFCPGTYTVTYDKGAYRYGAPTEFGWTINGNVDIVNPTEPLGVSAGFYVVLPGPIYVKAPGDANEYATQADCEAANAGASITFVLETAGSIGMVLADEPMDDNQAGSPNPTFTLSYGYVGGSSASPTVTPAVNVPGLVANFFEPSAEIPQNLIHTQIDQTVDYAYKGAVPAPFVYNDGNTVGIQWSGWLVPTFTETYTLTLDCGTVADYSVYVGSDGGAGLHVNNVLVAGGSDPGIENSPFSANVSLTAGIPVYIIVTNGYFDTDFNIVFYWQSASQEKEIVPESALITGNAPGYTYFGNGASYPAGLYYIEYTGGAFAYYFSGAIYWAAAEGQLVEAGGASAGTFPVAAGYVDGSGFSTATAAITASTGLRMTLCHTGGTIGIMTNVSNIQNWVNHDGGPDPTFRLVGPLPVVSLSYSGGSIDVGESAVLSWASNAQSTSIDHGVGSLTGASGSVTVSPTSTTTYTISGTVDGFTPVTAQATVVVNQPVAGYLTATGQCGGTILLAWSAGQYVTGYTVQRSTDGVNWSIIGTPASTEFTDTPPVAGQVYYYQVIGASGGVSSAPSNTASAASLVSAPEPVFGVVGHGRHSIVSWTVPSPNNGGAGLTVNVYRGTSSGGETLLVSGLPLTGPPAPNNGVGEYWDTGLTDQSTYYYRVSFVNGCGEGPLAAEQAVTAACCVNEYEVSTPPSTTSTAAPGESTAYAASTAPSTASNVSPPSSTESTVSTVASTSYQASAVPTSMAVTSSAPSSVSTGSSPPVSTAIVSGQPESTAVASTPPSTGYTASSPPSTGYEPDGCPG